MIIALCYISTVSTNQEQKPFYRVVTGASFISVLDPSLMCDAISSRVLDDVSAAMAAPSFTALDTVAQPEEVAEEICEGQVLVADGRDRSRNSPYRFHSRRKVIRQLDRYLSRLLCRGGGRFLGHLPGGFHRGVVAHLAHGIL